MVHLSKDESATIDTFTIRYNKKQKSLEWDAEEKTKDYVKCFDYHSTLIDMNKPMDTKKIIQSNNYLSFFIKQESLNNGKLTKEGIHQYYQTLTNPEKKYTKPKAKQLYQTVLEQYGEPDEDKIKNVEQWIQENIFELDKLEIELDGRDYLKIFFLFSDVESMVKTYIQEGNRYLIPNIYNNNDYNLVSDNIIFGVPNNNMGLNSKKIYLEHKTREVGAPYVINQEEVVLQKQFFDYLMNFAVENRQDIYFDLEKGEVLAYSNDSLPKRDLLSAIYLRIQKGKEVEVHHMDSVAGYRKKLSRKFIYQNVLGIDITDKKIKIENYPYGKEVLTVEGMQQIISSVCFCKMLINNYYTKPEDISITDDALKKAILTARESLREWFKLGRAEGAKQLLPPVVFQLIFGELDKNHFLRAQHLFNMYESLKVYFEGGDNKMGGMIEKNKESIRKKINEKDTVDFESEEEYFFAVGQMIHYLISLNKSGKKTLSLANPYFDMKDSAVLKQKLYTMYRKYNYQISVMDKRVGNLYAMISAYDFKGSINRDVMMAGFLSNSLIFEKAKGEL